MRDVEPKLHERWLVASEPAYNALTHHWRGEAGAGSILDWRVRNGLVECVNVTEVDRRVDALAARGETSICVVFDIVDARLLDRLERRAGIASTRLFEWDVAPMATVLAANAPDPWLLARLEGAADHPGGSAAVPDRAGLEAALVRWEQACRADSPDAFAEAYPNAGTAVAWRALLGAEQAPRPVNDNEWFEIKGMLAMTDPDRPAAFTIEDPDHRPGLWDITLAPIDGGPRALLRFRVNGAVEDFVGKRVWVRSGDRTIDLGLVDDTGRAFADLDTPIAMSAILVAIVED